MIIWFSEHTSYSTFSTVINSILGTEPLHDSYPFESPNRVCHPAAKFINLVNETAEIASWVRSRCMIPTRSSVTQLLSSLIWSTKQQRNRAIMSCDLDSFWKELTEFCYQTWTGHIQRWAPLTRLSGILPWKMTWHTPLKNWPVTNNIFPNCILHCTASYCW